MAYSRRAAKPDIRSLRVEATDQPSDTKRSSESSDTHSNHFAHNPIEECLKIALYSVPLMIILSVASYLDARYHWIIPLAERMFRLGQ